MLFVVIPHIKFGYFFIDGTLKSVHNININSGLLTFHNNHFVQQYTGTRIQIFYTLSDIKKKWFDHDITWQWKERKENDRGIILNVISHHSQSQSHTHHQFIINAFLHSHRYHLHPCEHHVISVLIPYWSDIYPEDQMIYSCPDARFIETHTHKSF